MSKRNTEMGLGKGLDALLGTSELQDEGGSPAVVPIEKVQPGLNQPRKNFDEETLAELAGSIREYGVIQPVTVRLLPSGYYQIIAGERRWRAARQAGLEEIPVRILEADDCRVLEIGLIENLQRDDLNPMEEADAYRQLMERFGLTQEAIAERIGKSRPAVANSLRLLNLEPAVQELVSEGTLTAGHGRALAGLEDPELQTQCARKAAEEHLSVRQTEYLVRRVQRDAEKARETPEGQEEPEHAPPADDVHLHLQNLSRQLTGSLGRRVRIQPRGSGDRGTVELEYYGTEDLERLLSLLGASGEPEGGEGPEDHG